MPRLLSLHTCSGDTSSYYVLYKDKSSGGEGVVSTVIATDEKEGVPDVDRRNPAASILAQQVGTNHLGLCAPLLQAHWLPPVDTYLRDEGRLRAPGPRDW